MLATFFAALAATALCAPLVRALMLRHGVLDVPNHRSSHVTPVPRGGGWACVVGLAVAALAAVVLDDQVPWSVLAGAVLLGYVGFVDDRKGLSPKVRLAAQAGTGLIIGAAFGGVPGAVAGAVLFASLVNSVNFMDGIDGITALSMAVWGGASVLVGASHDIPELTTLGALTAGCALGFLPWNAPTARLFLGDVGSYLFGALVAGGVILGWDGGAPPALLLAPMTVYLVDTGSTLLRRAVTGEPLLSAHRDHVYQRLVTTARLPHYVVAALVAGLAVGVTTMWVYLDVVLAALGTSLVAGVYLSLPRMMVLKQQQSG